MNHTSSETPRWVVLTPEQRDHLEQDVTVRGRRGAVLVEGPVDHVSEHGEVTIGHGRDGVVVTGPVEVRERDVPQLDGEPDLLAALAASVARARARREDVAPTLQLDLAQAPPAQSAWLSDDGLYRWTLDRHWGEGHLLTFVMCNPSTADGSQDDPTLRRCIGFARREGAGSLRVVNLYSYRATKPADLWPAADPVGGLTDQILRDTLADAGPVVAAWGAHPKPDRVAWLLEQPGAERLLCLGTTAGGQPRHPLYVRGDEPLRPLLGPASKEPTDG